MPAAAILSAMVCRVAWRMLLLAPCPITMSAVALAGRMKRAETSPFSGVATNLISFMDHRSGTDCPGKIFCIVLLQDTRDDDFGGATMQRFLDNLEVTAEAADFNHLRDARIE